MNTDCNPNRLRKYHDKLDTHRTSKSLVATPDCSIDLKRIVNGNGSFTIHQHRCQRIISQFSQWSPTIPSKVEVDILITNPAKNALIHPIIKVCGIIIAMFPFIMPIIPSIAAGSVIGFAAGLPLASGSFRNVPSLYADTK